MPIIIEFKYEDGTKEKRQYPAEIWRKNDATVSKLIASHKPITEFTIDPNEETADVNLLNNNWPKKTESQFEKLISITNYHIKKPVEINSTGFFK